MKKTDIKIVSGAQTGVDQVGFMPLLILALNGVDGFRRAGEPKTERSDSSFVRRCVNTQAQITSDGLAAMSLIQMRP